MAIEIGVNAGFVTTAPTSDPEGASSFFLSDDAFLVEDICPSNAVKINEIGIYLSVGDSNSPNWEVAIYDQSSLEPENIIGTKSTATLSSGAGWKKMTGLNIDVSSFQNQTLYIGFQMDASIGSPTMDRSGTGQGTTFLNFNITNLPDPWITSGTTSRVFATYAVYEIEEPTGTNLQINIGDVWKEVPTVQINIGDAWKEVTGMQINIGDSWKTIF